MAYDRAIAVDRHRTDDYLTFQAKERPMSNPEDQRLYLRFSGRIIDSLGIQMYQSPTAAIAELIANAWDADAKKVDVELPDNVGEAAKIEIRDDDVGRACEE